MRKADPTNIPSHGLTDGDLLTTYILAAANAANIAALMVAFSRAPEPLMGLNQNVAIDEIKPSAIRIDPNRPAYIVM
jgi:hypothetical protein